MLGMEIIILNLLNASISRIKLITSLLKQMPAHKLTARDLIITSLLIYEN